MADLAAAPPASVHPANALWRSVKQIDNSKINNWWLALRNSLAVAIPLLVGIEIGNALGGVAVAIGALNVSYSDGHDPYSERARRMLIWSVLSAVAVFVGSLGARFHVSAVFTAAAWAFVAGMMLAVSTRAGDLGLNTLVTVIVFTARGSATLTGAYYSALLVLAGGLIQAAMALLFWPLRRNKPQLVAIGQVYHNLAREVDPDPESPKFVPIRTISPQEQETLNALGRDHSVEGERFRLLYDQADRIRLSIYLLTRLRDQLGEGDAQKSEPEGDAAADLDNFLDGASKLLFAVGDVLATGKPSADFETFRKPLRQLVDQAIERKREPALSLATQIASAMDVTAGQLRMVTYLTTNTTEDGERAFLKTDHAKPWKLQNSNWRAIVRANMCWNSPVFRHALRLSVCVSVGELIGRSISWQRAYWLPMTVAVVLKPDFTTTFTRGFLRLAGTIAGLVLATVLYHLVPQSGWTQLLLVGGFTFLLRYLGPANYGVFTLAVSGLIVFLLAATGVAPGGVIAARALNTMAGGLLALLAYAAWPTWERTTIAESLAEMIEAIRIYFRGVADEFSRSEAERITLDQERSRWRLKRSAAEAAIDRVLSEPGSSQARAACLSSIMASSNALVNSVMGLEAGLVQSSPATAPETFRVFANDVEITLYQLASALRGSVFASTNLPRLRDDHRRLLESRDAFSPADEYILIETDRLTVGLNTLREQVERYLSEC